jgi:hypothetical protein
MHDASLEGTTFHACPTEKLEKGVFRRDVRNAVDTGGCVGG